MRTTVTRTGWMAAAATGAFLVAGCGGTEGPSASTASSPASFGQEGVRGDVAAAVRAAGLPEGKIEVGYDRTGRSASAATAADERKLAALITRISPCVVSWSSKDTGPTTPTTGPTEPRRQLDVVLSGLEKRDWETSAPATEAPVADNGTYFMATYKKQGWTLHARHTSLGAWSRSTVMATEDTCFRGITDEELALVEALSE
ncbi:hypothetical protein [Streptomyces sp. NPDC001536]|uniref:hypothetical protein n=1 Tax=Streptomyces sp. NPDC001536 TaxID=3364583 RepID=UPI003693A15C